MKKLVFVMIIVFLTFPGLGKFFRQGKNLPGGVEIHQVRTSETGKCGGPTLDIYNSIFVYQHT